MEKADTPGQMEDGTKEHTKKTRNKDREHILGLMVRNTLVSGKTEYKMEKENSQTLNYKEERENGKMVKE